MNRKENISSILLGFIIVILGIALVFFKESFVFLLAEIIQIILVLVGLWKLISAFVIRRGKDESLIKSIFVGKALIYIIIGLFFASRVEFTTGWLIFFIGLYQLAMGIIGLISYLLLRRDKVSDINSHLLIAMIHFLFGMTSMFGSYRITNTLFRLGVYLIFIGLTTINDGRQLLTRNSKTKKLRKRMRIPLPVFIEAIIPNNVMIRFNEKLSGDEGLLSKTPSESLAHHDYDEDALVHILIHVGATGFDKIGHVDVSYKGKVYSYGNHDVESHRIAGTIGDGVLVIADEKPYLEFLRSRRTSVFRFGINLKEDDLQAFKIELENILKYSTPWDITTEKQRKSFMGMVLEVTKGQAYKFNQGRYKTYFVLGTNCVLLADELLGSNGINIINLTGILAPGTYYDYFNKLFYTHGTNVVSKMLVHPKLDEPLVEFKQATQKVKKNK